MENRLNVTIPPIKGLMRNIYKKKLDHLLDYYYDLYITKIRHHGVKEATRLMKSIYVQAVQYSLYQDITPLAFFKSDRDGVSRMLKPFKKYLRYSDKSTRVSLQILRLYELSFVEPSRDYSSIIEPCQSSDRSYINKYFKKYLYKLQTSRLQINPPEDHLSNKKGPSGKMGLLSWWDDYLSLDKDSLESILYISQHFGEDQNAKFLYFEDLYKDYCREGETPIGKIQVFSEPGAKTRTIAIADYWTQRSLKPLHESIFKYLKKFDDDCTYDQSKAVKWLLSLERGDEVYSFDLSSATDRMPWELHYRVLKKFLRRRDLGLLPHYERLFKREFQLAWDPSTHIKYECGQPMGLYGSFGLLSLTHHMIVRSCGVKPGNYKIIGDDVIIKGSEGLVYKNFMNSIGVSLSPTKSIQSPKNSKHIVGEIAKRLVRDGVNISVITPNLLFKLRRDYRLFIPLIEELYLRGNDFDLEDTLIFARSLYSPKTVEKISAIGSFPNAIRSDARKFIYELFLPVSKWLEHDQTELIKCFISFQKDIIVRRTNQMSESLRESKSFGAPIDLGAYAPLIIHENPNQTVRRGIISQSKKLIKSLQSLSTEDIESKFSDIQEFINDKDLFIPDATLSFLRKDEIKRNFDQNMILEFQKHISEGLPSTPVMEEEIDESAAFEAAFADFLF